MRKTVTVEAVQQFRCVLTDTNQQTGIWSERAPAEAAVRFHEEHGEKAHVESRDYCIYDSGWDAVRPQLPNASANINTCNSVSLSGAVCDLDAGHDGDVHRQTVNGTTKTWID